MKTWWNYRPGEKTDEREEVTEQPNRFRMQEMTRGFSLFEEALFEEVSFLGIGPEHRPVNEGYNSCSECRPLLSCHL